jgi:hypothetical protein
MTAQFLLTILLDFNLFLPLGDLDLLPYWYPCMQRTLLTQQAVKHIGVFSMIGCPDLASPRVAMQVYQAKDVDASVQAKLLGWFIVRNRPVSAFNFQTRLIEEVTRRKTCYAA